MLKAKDADISALKLQEFAEQNSHIFHDQTIPEETYTPLTAPAT
jgi:hypothetical protein